jgi:hypothetical protein
MAVQIYQLILCNQRDFIENVSDIELYEITDEEVKLGQP